MGTEKWVEIPIKDIFFTGSGGTPSTSRPDFWEKGDVPWINSGMLKDEDIITPSHLITKLGLSGSSARLFPKDTIVIALTGATTGKVGYLTFECSTNQSVTGIFPSKYYNPRLLFYFLKSYRQELLEQCIGSAQPHINKEIVDNILIPLPPLAEQQRIVEKLDAIIPRVKAVKARLDKIPDILERFRQSVLAAACSGKLTEDWRENNPEIEIKGSNLDDEAFTFEIPDSWKIELLKVVSISMSTGPFGSMLHSYDYVENGIPVINPTNIVKNEIVPDVQTTIPKSKADELSRYKLKLGDVLLSRRGDLSKCGIVTKREENWIAGTGLFILRTKINPYYFRFYYQLNQVQDALVQSSIGSTMVNLNQKILGGIVIPLPPLSEQDEIIRQVDKLFNIADSLEAKYKVAMKHINKIEQTVLAKAFRGELAAQDPDDEPAEVLLERILKERAAVSKKTRS